jgi:hypothetical protein
MVKYILYLKTSPLGLKYLGKTTKDPYKYIGSGKIWLRHIKKNNIQADAIKTEILFETYNLHEFKDVAKQFSLKLDIVESNDFANLRIEDGDGGDTSKHIDYSNAVFHKKGRANHLNGVNLTEEERKKLFLDRSKLIDYSNPERKRKIKENTDWKKLIENRHTDYSKFLNDVHEKNKKAILQHDTDGNLVKEWKSAVDAAKELGIKPGTIRAWIAFNRIGLKSMWSYKNIANEKLHE